MNIGLDFGLWDRLNFTIEYYTRTTKNFVNGLSCIHDNRI